MLGIMVDPDGGFLEIRLICRGNFPEFLGVQVYNREPAALNLHHYAVTFGKKMGNFIEIK